jgi:hypothetical protein
VRGLEDDHDEHVPGEEDEERSQTLAEQLVQPGASINDHGRCVSPSAKDSEISKLRLIDSGTQGDGPSVL